MAMAALSPNSLVATPIQVNQQVKANLEPTPPQVTQDTQKSTKAAQTDTITISPQALQMTNDRNAQVQQTAGRGDEEKTSQMARERIDAGANQSQKNALMAYASAGSQK